MFETYPLEFVDEDEYKELIKNTERLFRTSKEYRKWLESIEERKECAVTGSSSDLFPIEVHHYGETLYYITQQIIDYFYEKNLPIYSWKILKALILFHKYDTVDYIPLLHCVHSAIGKEYNEVLELYPELPNKVHIGNKELRTLILQNLEKE